MLCPNWALNIKTDRGVNEANSEIFYLNFASFPFTVIVEFFPKDFTCTAAYLHVKNSLFVVLIMKHEFSIFTWLLRQKEAVLTKSLLLY